MIVCRDIERVRGGYIVVARRHLGDGPGLDSFVKVVCSTWTDVIALLDEERCNFESDCDCPACERRRVTT